MLQRKEQKRKRWVWLALRDRVYRPRWGRRSPLGLGFSIQIVTGCAVYSWEAHTIWKKKWYEKRQWFCLACFVFLRLWIVTMGKKISLPISQYFWYIYIYISESYTDKWVHYRLATIKEVTWINMQVMFESYFLLELHLSVFSSLFF